MPTRRRFVQLSTGVALSTALPLQARQELPLERVRILYGFPAGSGGDATARRVADKLGGTPYSRHAATVDNKPGAGGRLALESLKAAAPDGSTLAMSPHSCLSIYPHIYKRLAYDPARDFAAVSTSAVMHNALAVGPRVPAEVRTVRDFLIWAAANPAHANCGVPALGGTSHFIAVLLGMAGGIALKQVPYRGSVPGVADLIGGQIEAMMTPHGDFIAHHQAGRLRLLATSGAERSRFVPEVPTFAEQGFAALTVEEWFGFYAPAGTPPAIVTAASAAINAALRDPALIDGIGALGLIARGSTPQQMADAQRAEFERWGPLVKKIGFTAES